MADLKDKIENALNEDRRLVLGVQVLIGFQYQSVFQPGFARLSLTAQYLSLGSLGLVSFTLAWLMAPAAFHRLVVGGNDTASVLSFTTRSAGIALLPFSLGLAIDLYAAGERLDGPLFGLVTGLLTLILSLFFWYGLELRDRPRYRAEVRKQKAMSQRESSAAGGTPLSQKIKQVLTEARIVLPGVQALLGFQLMTMYTDGFDKLSSLLKFLHLAGLACIGLAMMLLMTPAAYHRLVEQGEDSERFHRFASRMLLAAMVFFTPGLALDLWVVVEKVTQSRAGAVFSAVAVLVLFYGLWFGCTLYRRAQVGARAAPG